MRKLIVTISITSLVTLVSSCGGCGNRDNMIQRVSNMANEASRIAEEEKTDTTLADKLIRITGDDLYDGERSFPDEEWEKMKGLTEDISNLKDISEGQPITKEALESIFANYGYDSFNEGRDVIKKYANLSEFAMGATIRISSVQTTRMLGDKEEIEKEVEELKEWLINKKLTKKDIIAIENNADIIGAAVGSAVIISVAQ